jgi:antirestriction protein ArdC
MAKSKKYDGPSPEEVLVSDLISLMEKGVAPWRRPWSATSSRHTNLLTGHPYSGSNPILLEMGMHLRGATHSLWVGADQARKENIFPKKGSKSVRILRPQLNKREDEKEDGTTELKAWTSFKIVPVFNVCDLQGEKLPELIAAYEAKSGLQPVDDSQRIAAAEEALDTWGVEVPVVHGGDKAFYLPDIDRICLPPFQTFEEAEEYYATAFHEAIHSTGHHSRLRRDLTGARGTHSYAIEELRAELGAVLLCNRLQIGCNLQNHAAYLTSWVSVLKEEPKILFKCLSDARKAVDLVLLGGEREANEQVPTTDLVAV